MILDAFLGYGVRTGWPRTSGDDPEIKIENREEPGLAPHERG